MIPFLDLKAQYQSIKAEVEPAVLRVLESCGYVLGPEVKAFEEEFAAYIGAKHAIACNTGTSALHLAFLSAGIGPGDEVITVPHTFIATTEAITQAGARPVFVDVDPATSTLDPARLEAAITPRTRAVIPVHLYGRPADMDPILDIARRRHLAVIEDACQAHGARYRGKRAGSMGHVGCFSFYPGKNLGAFGDAGALVTDDPEVARRARMLREHGQSRKYVHDTEGYTGRLDALQAAVLRLKLSFLEEWNRARRENAKRYDELLSGISGLSFHRPHDGIEPVYHLYVVFVEDREGLREHLGRKGIGTGLHYPLPLHLQQAYAAMGHRRGDFPVSEHLAERLLSLPMYAELAPEQIEHVASSIREFQEGRTVR